MNVVVVGGARAGCSTAMQVLAAGGWPVVGEYPRFSRGPARSEIPELAERAAIKMLAPMDPWPWAERPALAVLASRDPLIQAHSQIKMLQLVHGRLAAPDSKRGVEQIARTNAEVTARLRSKLQSAKVPLFEWPFVRVLKDPWGMAMRLSTWLAERTGEVIDVERGSAMIMPRKPSCYDGMLEELLVESYRRAQFAKQDEAAA